MFLFISHSLLLFDAVSSSVFLHVPHTVCAQRSHAHRLQAHRLQTHRLQTHAHTHTVCTHTQFACTHSSHAHTHTSFRIHFLRTLCHTLFHTLMHCLSNAKWWRRIPVAEEAFNRFHRNPTVGRTFSGVEAAGAISSCPTESTVESTECALHKNH